MNRRAIIPAAILLVVCVTQPVVSAQAAELTAADLAFLDKKIIARWEITGPADIADGYALGIDILEDHPNPATGYVTVLVDSDQLARLRADGYKLDVQTYDWYASYAQKSAVPLGGFRNYDQCTALMDSIYTSHPDITTPPFAIGTSFEDRIIWAIKVSDNPSVDEDEVEVLFTGLHHAREPIGMEVCLETLRRLTDGYGTDARITTLVNEREIYFVPIVNPDGYEYNRQIAPNGGGLWRKNRNNTGSSVGIDLNRNYSYQWGFDDLGSSSSPPSQIYRGPAPFSELETHFLRTFINARDFLFVMNFHAYSNLYLWSWGYDYIYTPDQWFFEAVGESLATYNGYAPQVSWELYPANGVADDWMYGATGEHKKIFSFTPEVGSSSDGFWPNPANIPALIEENQAANLALIGMDYADFSGAPVSGDAPLTVNFTELARGTPTAWIWQFGDGDSVSEANPAHVFDPGIYTIALRTVTATGGIEIIKTDYVTAVAESLGVADGNALPTNTHVWDITLTNHVPITTIDLPIAVSRVPSHVTLDSVVTTGTRTEYFESVQVLFDNSFNGQIVVRLTADNGGGAPPLAPGAGAILRVYLSIKPDAIQGDTVALTVFDPVATLPLTAATTTMDFAVIGDIGTITILTPPCACQCHTDPQCDGEANVLDVVQAVDVAFRNQPPDPDPLYFSCNHEMTDVDCNGVVDVIDVVHLTAVAFRNEDPAGHFCDPCAP